VAAGSGNGLRNEQAKGPLAQDKALTGQERQALRALGLIYVSRQLGLYMVLPVLSPYVSRLHGATPLLIGLSLGVYGGGQAILQVPFGYLSDRIGRKRVINLGLILFLGGSLLGALARTAWLLVLARAIQGSAAFSSVILALIGDVTRENVRAQAMGHMGAWIGITIGISFVIGPTLGGFFGVPLLFLITAGGTLVALSLLNLAVPNPARQAEREWLRVRDVWNVIGQRPLLMVDIGIFLLHTAVTVLFVVLPFEFEKFLGSGRAWEVLVPAIAVGLATMFFVGRYADRHGRTGFFFYIGAGLLGLSCLAFTFMRIEPRVTFVGLFLFTVAIATLEPILATLLSRFSEGPAGGTASGVYSMAQFVGAFIGGLLGGLFLHRLGTMFFILFFAIAIWFSVLLRMAPVRASGEAR
jgi:MFS family permease